MRLSDARWARKVRVGNTPTTRIATNATVASNGHTRPLRTRRPAGAANAGSGRRYAAALVEVVLEPQQPVELGHPLAAGGRARLDLPAVRRHREVGDRRVLGLAAAVRHDRGVAGRQRQFDGVEGLAQRADLVDLHEDRVGDAAVDAPPEPVDIGDEHVVAHELDATAERGRERGPAVPVLLAHAVLDGDDRVPVHEVREPGRHLAASRAGGPRRPARTCRPRRTPWRRRRGRWTMSSPGR